MVPDFNNDGKLSPWEGAAAEMWRRNDQARSAVRHGGGKMPSPRRSGGGCRDVAFGCVLIFGLVFVVAIVLVLLFNLITSV